jgi:putative oxidoreductase
VSKRFYLGLFNSAILLNVFGVVQTLVGVLVIVGLWRRFALPAVALMNLVSLLAVWRSIVDPWGWWLEGTNVLFFPSLIIFAGTLVLWAFLREDEISLDERDLSGAAHPFSFQTKP